MGAPPMCFGIPTAEGPPFVLDMNANMLKDRSKLPEALQTLTRRCGGKWLKAVPLSRGRRVKVIALDAERLENAALDEGKVGGILAVEA